MTMAKSTSIPKPRFTSPAPLDTIGQHDLGELDLLDELALADDGVHRIADGAREPLEGDHGREQEDPKSCWSRAKMTCITNTYTSSEMSGSSTHQTLPRTVSVPFFLTSARTR